MSDPNKPKSCFDCPSLISTPQEQIAFFGKQIGVPTCARFGKPIGKMGSNEKQAQIIAQAVAKNCSKYGEPRPTTVDWEQAEFFVALPDPQILQFNPKVDQDRVRNCRVCQHFTREDVVAANLGWAPGLCSVKGKLILGNRTVYEARGCEERSFSQTIRTDTLGITLLPEYEDDFTLSTDPVKFHQAEKKNWVDPSEYPSDLPVTDFVAADGIRAWRRVFDPVTENETFLPVFRRDFFSEAEQEMIPSTGDEEHPEDYVDHAFFTYKVAVLWRELDETPAAWGQAGVGKTEFGRYMAWLMQVPFIRISINGSSEVEDLAGKWLYDPEKGTYWQDGRLVHGWSHPCVMLVDEPNAGPPDVYQLMRPMMDNSKQLVLDQARGERRDRSDYCHLLVAMNPAWDPKNVGTHQISDADANRMMHIHFELPPAQLEKEILTTRCKRDDYDLPNETLHTIMSIAADIRALSEEDTLPITWGIRPQLKVARASRWFDLKTCYRMASADFLEPEQRELLMDVVKAHTE